MTTQPSDKYLLPWICVLILFTSCSKDEKVPRPYQPRDSYDAYSNSLILANLDQTALGKDWISAGKQVFDEQVELQLPHQEAFLMEPKTPEALGYRFSAKRGHKIIIDLEQVVGDSAILFIDAFRVINDSLGDYRHVASADSSWQLAFEPRRDSEYILRFQPELLRGGSYKIDIQHGPALEFPVAGKNKRAIQSFFGDPRDGGRREHHGVDIFAKRGTPIISPAKGYVRFAGTRGIGGKVIWIRDSKRNQSLYFAHLDSLIIESGTYVNLGDTIGTVGNTGNARTTPPHLHFGIYSNGPINPFSHIAEITDQSVPIGDHLALLGQPVITTKYSFLRNQPKRRSTVIDTLQIDTALEVEAIIADYLRVTTPEGTQGYLQRQLLQVYSDPTE